jgi:WD40 repeat protein
LKEYNEERGIMRGVSFSDDGRFFVIWNQRIHTEYIKHEESTNQIRIYDWRSKKVISSIEKTFGLIDVKFTYDGKYVVMSCYDAQLRVWSLVDNKLCREIKNLYQFLLWIRAKYGGTRNLNLLKPFRVK